MNRLLLLLGATALATTPVAAQHTGHDPHAGHVMPAKKPPPKKKPVAKKPAAKKPAAKKAAPKIAAPKPAAKKAPAKPAPAKSAADPHAGHQVPATPPPTDPHAGHAMQAQPPVADPDAGHDMSATAVDVPIGPPPAEALQGPENAADVAWGRGAMAPSQAVLFQEHGDLPAYKVLIDQLEARVRSGRNGYFLNAEGWYGGDIDKLWLKTEIEGDFGGRPEQAEFQALWSHAIDPWFDLQAGVRFDAEPDTRGRLVVGVQGLAPYWIEVDAAAFLSDKGDVTARAEAEHDVRITQKLILQPRVELDFALQDIPRERAGSGLTSAELGLRLRYEFVPNFAPYFGVSYERAFGDTRKFLRAEGDDPDSLNLVAGIRAWF